MRILLLLTLLPLLATGCRPSEAEVLDRMAVTAGADDETPRLRRVWAAAGDYATPSPDGRLVAFVDWTTGDVAVHDLGTAASRRITAKGTWTENGSWAEYPVFSPDGRRVAYAYGNVLTGDPFRYELRYVELGDTTQHLLRAIGTGDDWIAPLDWSERGILFTHYTTPDESSLGILDPATGRVTVLEPAFGRGRGSGREGRFSPDGRYVAYWMNGLKVRDLERGSVTSLDASSTSLIDWTADGRALLVHAIHDGRAGLWTIPVANGRQVGQPRLIRDGIPAVVQGGGRAGEAFYYAIPVDAPRVHLATVDLEGGRLLAAPVALTTPMDGGALFPVWSPDGSQLAYLLRPLNNQGETRLMVREAEGDGVRELARLRLGRLTSLAWSPDGRRILAVERASRDLYGISVEDGAVNRLLEDVGLLATMAPDGRTVAAVTQGETDHPTIVAIDVRSGERRVLEQLTGRGARGISFSPDGRSLVYVAREPGQGASEIRVLPLNGGRARVAARAEFPLHFDSNDELLPWSPDGRHVLVVGGEWEGENSHDLMAVTLESGDYRPLGLGFPGNPSGFSLHPAGDRLAFVDGDRRAELWVLDRIDD